MTTRRLARTIVAVALAAVFLLTREPATTEAPAPTEVAADQPHDG